MIILRLPNEFYSMNVLTMHFLILVGFILIGIYLYLKKNKKEGFNFWGKSKEIYSSLIIYTILMTVSMFVTVWVNKVDNTRLDNEMNQIKEEFISKSKGISSGNVTEKEIVNYMNDLYNTEKEMVRLKRRKGDNITPLGKIFVEGSKEDVSKLYERLSEEQRISMLRADYNSLNTFTDIDLALKDSEVNNNNYQLTREQFTNIKEEQEKLNRDLKVVRENKGEKETFLDASLGWDITKRFISLLIGGLLLSYLITLIVKYILGSKDDNSLDNFDYDLDDSDQELREELDEDYGKGLDEDYVYDDNGILVFGKGKQEKTEEELFTEEDIIEDIEEAGDLNEDIDNVNIDSIDIENIEDNGKED